TLEVVAAEAVTPDIVHLRLKSPAGHALPSWTAGSHIDIECGDTGLSRQYSLCGNLENTDEWEVAVLRDPDSRGGSEWICRYATAGAKLRLRGPRNHFHLNEGAERLMLVAGGIGITPIMAMAQRARALGKDYELHYSCASRSHAAFLDTLRELHGNRLHLHVSDEGTRCDFDQLLAEPDDMTDIHACGPARMLNALQTAADGAGWRPYALHVEHFVTDAPKLDPDKEISFEVELRNTGLTLQVPADKTVLQVLNAANVDVQCDCEEGLCGTCEVAVLEGDIDHRDVVLNPAEREANNRMMSCCSRSRSGRLVLDI
ncbi:MAG: PDR/VanB family oxidoreductase, partial [Alcaligenaceae bacterium]|nr:PDR/VanB family oxidoreductase [Alcaligenaceae bacterium]